jgi:hypothetical protein
MPDTMEHVCPWPSGECLLHSKSDLDLELNPVTRLTRDLRKGAATLGDTEARFLVDAYYIMQENRKRAAGQERALNASGEPHEIITWLKNQNATMEGQIKAALDVYTQAHMMGGWMREVYGIGPVISAGLLAHIKIERAPTVGHIWSYAGIAGPVTNTELRRAVYRVAYRNPIPQDIIPTLHLEPPYEATYLYPDGNSHAFFQVVVESDVAHPAILDSVPRIIGVDRTFRAFSGNKPWVKGEKRPWNAGFKTLCWKAGHSFMMFSNDEQCFYGQLYRRRKEREVMRNENGEFRDIAKIRAETVGKTTDAYAAYSKGILPPAHIDAMARRYTVKIFLSHLHEEWYWRHHGKDAPAPFAIAQLGHAHYIPSPIPRRKG